MTARPLPTHCTASATILLTKGWPQRSIKQVRQDCAEAARQIEKGEAAFDPTGAILSAHRDLKAAQSLIPSLRLHLTATKAVASLLRGEDHEPPVASAVYEAAKTMRAVGLEAKAIDENAGLSDFTDTLEAVDATSHAMAHDLQTLISNVAPARKEFVRLLVAALGTGKASMSILGENVFDNDETELKAQLPADVLDELGWRWIKGSYAFDAKQAKALAEACRKSMERSIRAKNATRAQQSVATAKALDDELQRRAEAATEAMKGAAQ
jgi:hypothetical protein